MSQSNPSQASKQNQLPTWFWVVAIGGVLWNVFGVIQFVQSLQATKESLMAAGLTELQAQTMTTYPAWMTVAFGIGTIGGTLGSLLLVLKKASAKPVFVASLIAYVVLYIGDITQGVFEAMGTPQVVILTTVVAIAAGLLGASVHFQKRQLIQ